MKLTKIKKVEVIDLLNEGKTVTFRNKFQVLGIDGDKMKLLHIETNSESELNFAEAKDLFFIPAEDKPKKEKPPKAEKPPKVDNSVLRSAAENFNFSTTAVVIDNASIKKSEHGYHYLDADIKVDGVFDGVILDAAKSCKAPISYKAYKGKKEDLIPALESGIKSLSILSITPSKMNGYTNLDVCLNIETNSGVMLENFIKHSVPLKYVEDFRLA